MGYAEARAEEHRAAKDELYVKLYKARNAAKAFFRYQDAEARRLGYKSGCEFAHLIANGTVPAPPFVDDAELELVSRWFNGREPVNRWALLLQFDSIHGGIPWIRMRDRYPREGWNRDKFNRRIKDLLRDLGGQL